MIVSPLSVNISDSSDFIYLNYGDSNHHPIHSVKHNIISAHGEKFIEFEDENHLHHFMLEFFGLDSDEYPLFSGNEFDDNLSHCINLNYFIHCVKGRELFLDEEVLSITFSDWSSSFLPFIETKDYKDSSLLSAFEFGNSNVWSLFIQKDGSVSLILGLVEFASSYYVTAKSYPLEFKSIDIIM